MTSVPIESTQWGLGLVWSPLDSLTLEGNVNVNTLTVYNGLARDGATATDQDPTHSWASDGSYPVSLTVSNLAIAAVATVWFAFWGYGSRWGGFAYGAAMGAKIGRPEAPVLGIRRRVRSCWPSAAASTGFAGSVCAGSAVSIAGAEASAVSVCVCALSVTLSSERPVAR